MEKLADEIGVDRKIYKTALTEVGVNFALYEQSYRAFQGPKDEAVRNLAAETIEPAAEGALKLLQKFPSEPQNHSFIYQLEEYEKRQKDGDEQEGFKAQNEPSPLPQVVDSLALMLRQQLLLGGEPELEGMIRRDPFFGGYLTHFCAIGSHKLAHVGLSAEETAPYTRAVMAELLGDENAFDLLLSEIWNSKSQPSYQKGRVAANDDIFDWIENEGRKSPMGLLHHIVEVAKSKQ